MAAAGIKYIGRREKGVGGHQDNDAHNHTMTWRRNRADALCLYMDKKNVVDRSP